MLTNYEAKDHHVDFEAKDHVDFETNDHEEVQASDHVDFEANDHVEEIANDYVDLDHVEYDAKKSQNQEAHPKDEQGQADPGNKAYP